VLAFFRALNEIQHNYSYLNSYILRVSKSSLVCHLSLHHCLYYCPWQSSHQKQWYFPTIFFLAKEKASFLFTNALCLHHPFLHRCSLLRFCTSKAGIQTMKHRMTVPIITVYNYDTVTYMYLTLSSHEMTIAGIPRMCVHVQIVDTRHSPECLDSRLH